MTPNPPLPDEPIGACFIDGGDFRPMSELAARYAELDGFVYEVVRIISGVPLFLEDHAARLSRSARLSGRHTGVPIEHLSDFILELIERTGSTAGNVKISLGGGSSEQLCLVSFIKSRYPDDAMYRSGVSVGIFPGERRDPTVKRHNPELRRRLTAELTKSGHYDLLLESGARFLTEGSKTNIFFVHDDALLTPRSEDVLPGITRLKVVEIARRLDIPLTEARVHRHELPGFDAVFLTGTSAKILPVSSIDGRPFRVDHPLVRRLMAAYDRLIDEYVQTTRAATA